MGIIRKQIKLIKDKSTSIILLMTATIKDLGFFDTPVYTYNYSGYSYGDGDNYGIGLDNLD
jgi:hypothetical protein